MRRYREMVERATKEKESEKRTATVATTTTPATQRIETTLGHLSSSAKSIPSTSTTPFTVSLSPPVRSSEEIIKKHFMDATKVPGIVATPPPASSTLSLQLNTHELTAAMQKHAAASPPLLPQFQAKVAQSPAKVPVSSPSDDKATKRMDTILHQFTATEKPKVEEPEKTAPKKEEPHAVTKEQRRESAMIRQRHAAQNNAYLRVTGSHRGGRIGMGVRF